MEKIQYFLSSLHFIPISFKKGNKFNQVVPTPKNGSNAATDNFTKIKKKKIFCDSMKQAYLFLKIFIKNDPNAEDCVFLLCF